MLLGLYVFVMICLLLSQLVSSYIGWLILGVVAVVSYLTTSILATGYTKKKKALVAGLGFVILSTMTAYGMVFMESSDVRITDYVVPFIFVLCHPIAARIRGAEENVA